MKGSYEALLASLVLRLGVVMGLPLTVLLLLLLAAPYPATASDRMEDVMEETLLRLVRFDA